MITGKITCFGSSLGQGGKGGLVLVVVLYIACPALIVGRGGRRNKKSGFVGSYAISPQTLVLRNH
jgi:hypothetical protein